MTASSSPPAHSRRRRASFTVPGPRQRYPGEFALAVIRRPLALFTDLARTYGDVAGFRIAGQPVVLVSHPDRIRDVLVTHGRLFHKGRGLERAKMLLGEGLLTSEDELHLRQRRLAQPAFHRARIAAYADTMATYAARRAERWRDGATLDVSREMAAYTLAVVGKTLFDADIEGEAHEIGDALAAAIDAFNLSVLPFGELLEKLPIPTTLRFRRGRERLDATIYRLIAERRASGEDRGDLLSMLLLAQDTEGDGGGMSDAQLRDEAMTLLLAGHETTANLLAWTWYLLAQHPEVERRLHDEIDAVAVATHSARTISRDSRTRAPCSPSRCDCSRRRGSSDVARWRSIRIDEHVLPARTIVLTSQWVVHRDPRWWPDADVVPARALAAGRQRARSRRARSSPTSRSAPARASASASSSPGSRASSPSRPSRAAGDSGWRRAPPSSRSRSSRCACAADCG